MDILIEREFVERFCKEYSLLMSYLLIADIYKDSLEVRKERIVQSYNNLKILAESYYNEPFPAIEVSNKTTLDFTQTPNGYFAFLHWYMKGGVRKGVDSHLYCLRNAV